MTKKKGIGLGIVAAIIAGIWLLTRAKKAEATPAPIPAFAVGQRVLVNGTTIGTIVLIEEGKQWAFGSEIYVGTVYHVKFSDYSMGIFLPSQLAAL